MDGPTNRSNREDHESESIIKYGVFHTTLMRRHVHVTPACMHLSARGRKRNAAPAINTSSRREPEPGTEPSLARSQTVS
jgi:hypothetical protein